jgi:peptide/nickel transport system permease protein
MTAYIIRRLLAMIPLLLFISLVVFGLTHLAPGDPAITMVGGRQTSAEVLDAIRQRYHLNESLPKQYVLWLSDISRGNLGESFRHKQEVGTMIVQRLPISLKLAGGGFAIAMLFAFPLGILTAVYRDTAIDRAGMIFMVLGGSTPVFFSGVIAILVFSFWLGWLPSTGYGRGFTEEVTHLLLPCTVLGLSLVALTGRMVRGNLIEALSTPYVMVARAKGLQPRTVVLGHALKNAIIPVITVASIQMGYLLVGAVLVEYTFGLGGLGGLLVTAILDSDYPVVQGITLFMAVIFLVTNLIVDILYVMVDPRIRYD